MLISFSLLVWLRKPLLKLGIDLSQFLKKRYQHWRKIENICRTSYRVTAEKTRGIQTQYFTYLCLLCFFFFFGPWKEWKSSINNDAGIKIREFMYLQWIHNKFMKLDIGFLLSIFIYYKSSKLKLGSCFNILENFIITSKKKLKWK